MTARAHQGAAFAAEAYRRGLWVTTTLADSLRAAAETLPQRMVLVDADTRLDCAALYSQATQLNPAPAPVIPPWLRGRQSWPAAGRGRERPLAPPLVRRNIVR